MGVNQSNSQVCLICATLTWRPPQLTTTFLHTAYQCDETEELIQGLYLAGCDTTKQASQ